MRSYRSFIHDMAEQLVAAVADAENQGWHHQGEGTPLFQHYLRLCTWADELTTRRAWYDYIKARRPAWVQEAFPELAAPTGGRMVRSPDRDQRPELGPSLHDDDSERGGGRAEGDDPGSHVD